MFAEYIQAPLAKAEYEMIALGLVGVWATGKTIEDCRNELIEAIEEWIVAKLQWGQPIPTMGGHTITTFQGADFGCISSRLFLDET